MDRATGEVIRPYERARPGDLIHVDVKEFALIPPGGGWKVHGRAQTQPGRTRRDGQRRRQREARGTGRAGNAFVHSAVDDHSRLAHCEVHNDETAATTAGFLTRALASYANHAITVSEVLRVNGPAYRSTEWAHVNAAAGITTCRTQPYRP